MATKREPLAVKNSAIPKPSRLMQPGTLAAMRKRPAQASIESQDKENGPVVKRAKVETPPNTTITATSSSTTAGLKKGASTGSISSINNTAKPKGKVATTAAMKKAVKATITTSRVTSKSTTNANKKTATSSRSTAASSKTTSTKGSTASGAGGKVKGTAAGGGGGGKQKRSPWDLKGRLQDMETMMADERKFSFNTIGELQTQLVGLSQRLEELEGVRQQQEGTIIAKQEENTAASSQIKALENELSSTKKEFHESTMKYERELEMLRLSKSALQRSTEQLESELKVSRMEATSLKEVVARMTADASAIQCQLDATKAARDQAQEESALKSREIARLEGEVATHLQTISECKTRIREDEMVRRKLHNTIQELKGNIRVFCRVRPFLPGEIDSSCGDGRESICSNGSRGSGKGSKVTSPATQLQICYPDKEMDRKKIALQYSSEQTSAAKNYEFDFDRVFGPQSTQEQVFEEISQLVQSVLDGYNVCIFAYGQTGSGKTFTMEGPEDPLTLAVSDEGAMVDRRGMISRAVEQVFSSAIEMGETGWEYKMSASFLEIYNESLRDLLSSSSNGSSTQSHEIKIDPERPGQVYVTNLTPVSVTSEKQVESLLERASKNRAVAATLCNERSSRSHSVFMLKITGSNQKTGQKCEGTLNLIDLAGSERLSQSGSQGERLKETKNINKSLSNLGNVIMALANKDSHVPYRNSKLTYLLQNSLGGNSKTLMFVNMSPLAESMQESLCSLRFATKVNQCNIGTAKKTMK